MNEAPLKVLLVLCWHPTSTTPNYCKWILPHIQAARITKNDITVLHLEVVNNHDDVIDLEMIDHDHYHSTVYVSKSDQKRNCISYAKLARTYTEKLSGIYKMLSRKNGIPDVIHAHVSLPAGYSAAKIGKIDNIPVIVSEHYSGFESDMRFFWRTRRFINEMMKEIHTFTAVSAGFLNRVKKTKVRNTPNFIVLENPIDTKIFRYKEETGQNSGILKIVTVATNSTVKGTDLLLSALQKFEDTEHKWSLKIIGNFDKEGILVKSFFDNPYIRDRVTVEGRLNQHSMAEIYHDADLYVVSSRSETANVSMLEAMSCGIYVLSTKCGGPETLLPAGMSTLVNANSDDAIYAGLVEVFEQKGKVERRSISNFVEDNYSIEKISEKLDELYVGTVSENGR
ncbi:glycosyltransferase family 4 protein [Enterovibrio sp. 27052020O]|uniref:glycosyltransferase family 4 protein n=1 Tax=Enterovibrio sp. 27052020O TaxID=3241166 RepID=UPI00388F2331